VASPLLKLWIRGSFKVTEDGRIR